MADPVNNLEIEDVLSSIRRLVSDEARTPIREVETPDTSEGDLSVSPQEFEIKEENVAEAAESEEQSQTPALVLTAALRVEEPESDAVVATEEATPETQERKPLLILRNERASFEPEIEAIDPVVETAELDGTLEFATPLPDDLQPEDETTEVEDLQHQASENVEAAAEPSTEEPDDAFEATNFEAEDEADEAQAAVDQEADQASAVEANEQNEEQLSIGEKIAALEALINNAPTEFEPDGAEDGANAARFENALPWEDNFEPVDVPTGVDFPDPDEESQKAEFDDAAVAFQKAHEEAVQEAQAETEANVAETLLDDEDLGAVLDEEALRDMVAEIVRQELQGPLGERITRNVRKLVRREIHRALAEHDLG
ncbi:hypothetical protein [Planktotalea sp.]|uniref:hypothetical protein n=1 Tax=Planktotalea sp. TaxID=2029877 RepID=UPI0032990769